MDRKPWVSPFVLLSLVLAGSLGCAPSAPTSRIEARLPREAPERTAASAGDPSVFLAESPDKALPPAESAPPDDDLSATAFPPAAGRADPATAMPAAEPAEPPVDALAAPFPAEPASSLLEGPDPAAQKPAALPAAKTEIGSQGEPAPAGTKTDSRSPVPRITVASRSAPPLPLIGSGAPPPPAPTPAKPDPFNRVRILYATDRQCTGDTPNNFYGSARSPGLGATALACGQCDVSIPFRHVVGEIERPSLWRLEFSEKPTQHVTVLSVQPMSKPAFAKLLQTEVGRTASKSVLLFVHGFNVTFADAAYRTAQMKFDLMFDGAAVMYTWPAPKNYVECEGNAVWTRPHLLAFLIDYLHRSGAQQIHLIAHSMGTRVLTDALSELVQLPDANRPRYNQIILAAPDIDAAVFKQQIAPRIVKTAERISIYASSNDWALAASKAVHNYPRLGESGESIAVFPEYPKIEVVDTTAIDEGLLGHSYYGDSPLILRDIQLVLAGTPAIRRGLESRSHYFRFIRR